MTNKKYAFFVFIVLIIFVFFVVLLTTIQDRSKSKKNSGSVIKYVNTFKNTSIAKQQSANNSSTASPNHQVMNKTKLNAMAEEFLQDQIPLPDGFKSLKEMNNQFLSEKITDKSIILSNNLRNILLQVNYLGPEAKFDGVECREKICRVISSFSGSASADNVNIAMRQLQRLKPHLFRNAGIDGPISISTRVTKAAQGPSFLAFYSI